MASILDRIKQTLVGSVKTSADTARAQLLRKGGELIASTPEGQAGIKDELLRRGQPWGAILIGGVALYFLLRAKRR